MDIATPHLGVPKAITSFQSGEMRDTGIPTKLYKHFYIYLSCRIFLFY
jgi:hypothetical protein